MALFEHKVIAIRPHWHGLKSVKHLVIFGDSYSSVDYNGTKSPHPTPQEPLGVPFPGRTWASINGDDANWVGFIVNTIADERKDLLVYDYAVGGDRVESLERQVGRSGFETIRDKPDWAPWTAADSLFVAWFGINDCAYINAGRGEEKSSISALFAYQERLYEAGARNFMFIDVPPMHLSPAKPMSPEDIPKSKIAVWNTELRSQATQFGLDHPDATILLFSSWYTFSVILNKPTEYGLKPEDVHAQFSSVWVDHLHPSSSVHRGVALAIYDFLNNTVPNPT
ncbi:carbohydrate esterase family 16 protein [Peniophora sp. CONT]|nr:carbohydrate esterase family 16 protein [Peniophora sp. CONT]